MSGSAKLRPEKISLPEASKAEQSFLLTIWVFFSHSAIAIAIANLIIIVIALTVAI